MGTPVRLVILLLSLSVGGIGLHAQSSYSVGIPVIRNYTPAEYDAHNQNWALVQDSRGMMHLGNSAGVLEYDGVSWRKTQVKERRIARSLAVGSADSIFVGGHGDIGYLDTDLYLKTRFVSLLPKVDSAYRDFADVWQTITTPSGTFYITEKYLFRLQNGRIKTWPTQTGFSVGLWYNDRLFIMQMGVGLMVLNEEVLQPVSDGEKVANEPITAILPFSERGKEGILLVSLTGNIFIYDGTSVSTFSTEATSLLSRAKIVCAASLFGDRYALGTMLDGVVIIDVEGRFLMHLNKVTGLQDDAILSLYEDRQRGLWIGMQKGVARAEIGSPHRYFAMKEGIEGSVWQILRHQGKLYMASIMGLFYLEDGRGADRCRIERVEGVSPQCWSLESFGDVLLVGTFDGIYELNAGRVRRISNDYAFALHRSRIDSNRVFVGMRNGVKSLYHELGNWYEEEALEGISEEIRHIFETSDGRLWLTDYFSGLLLADMSEGYHQQPPVSRFSVPHGLPPPDRVMTFQSDRGLRFATLQGVFRFDEVRQRFYADTTLVEGVPNQQLELFSVSKDQAGNLWMVADDNSKSGVARLRPGGGYYWEQSPFLRIAGHPVITAYHDPDNAGITWIGGTDLLIRYDDSVPSNHEINFTTLIRQVVVNGDSLIYNGAGLTGPRPAKLSFDNNSVRFRYAAPGFDDESQTQFRYMLEGYDQDWSNWTTETYKDYTGLPQGAYRFKISAKNTYGLVGQTGIYEFRVLPPFYLTWWAYVVYTLIVSGLIFKLFQFGQRRLLRKHQQEIARLEFEKLRELDETKSRFFINISHEFRTPLTLILGPVDQLLAGKPKEEDVQQFRLIKRNARRLLGLVDQLLDLSKLDAGKMKLESQYADIIPLLKRVVSQFESMTQKTALRFESELATALLYFDAVKIEQAVTNLLSNAFKFTPEGGAVTLSVASDVSASLDRPHLRIAVTDTGSGIPEEHLPFVFDRFYQVSEIGPGGEVGSGIGLALTRELVTLHKGVITVSNMAEGGARFAILLPFPDKVPPTTDLSPEEEHGQRIAAWTELQPVQWAGEAQTDYDTTLLIVEDNPDMRLFLRQTFADSFRVIEAVDAEEGINLALQQVPDIVVSDVMMPGKNGLELLEDLKSDERTSHIPIVLLTARTDVQSRIAGLERGADDYLGKPFYRDELLLRVRNLLEGRLRLQARYASGQTPAPSDNPDVQIEDVFLQKIRLIVEEYLSDDTFEIDRLSRLAGMSRSQLFRKIKALTGRSPSLFIRTIRLHRARQLLLDTDLNISEVAALTGFSTPAYFSDVFIEEYGIRPSQLKK